MNLRIMSKFSLPLAVFIIVIVALALFLSHKNGNKSLKSNTSQKSDTSVSDNANQSSNPDVSSDAPSTEQPPMNAFQSPLDRAGERVTKKKFGQYITRENSPVQPEKFRGYHTGTDFEIFPEELNSDVEVKAICDGKLLASRTASGYGGMAVESCELNNQSITVVYGHINISSVKFKVGDQIKSGDIIALLGANESAQTDGERKHLHLAIHKGSGIDIRGYVQNQSELSQWIDPCSLDSICR